MIYKHIHNKFNNVHLFWVSMSPNCISHTKVGILHSFKRSMCEINPQNTKPKLDFKSKLENVSSNPNNSSKDLILFNTDQSHFFKFMNLFAVTQFGFWTYMGMTLFTMNSVEVSADTRNNKELPWWRKHDFAYYKIPMGLTAFTVGWGVLAGCWIHILRTVLHIVLRKGGKTVTFATHTPLGGARFITVPLEKVSARTGRINRSYAAIKIQGRPLHYLVDTEGNFVRPLLYDKTVGVTRKFKS